ncbi:DUF6520 family protein [Epilithonimonas sp.]|uniref:DUF6520 family protein n=1 Tax=Epilithonimonas sp. TaxID=2894511 RepID=UPI00289C6516|nr:DUF6520 family protein [Epilithonimonas sp.]
MKKLIFPAFVTLIGAGGALASQNAKNNESTLAVRQGYIFNVSNNNCDRSVMCSTDPGPICTVNGLPAGQQVFGTSGSDVEHPLTCSVTLSKIQ